MKPTAISLFCGAGGCSLGFEQGGYNILFATDCDKAAVETYRTNFPETQCEEAKIEQVDFQALMGRFGLQQGDLDVLIGGPPCQGFSTAGTRFWDDPRNRLLKEYVSALRTIKPKWFVMENVEGLLTAKNGDYVTEAVKAFIKLGYSVHLEKVYSQEYGIPQRRKRVLIIGNSIGFTFAMPKPTALVNGSIFRASEFTLKDAIGELPHAARSPQTGPLAYPREALTEWELSMRSPHGLKDHYSIPAAGIQLERIKTLGAGQTMKDLPADLQHLSFSKRANRRVADGTPTEKRGGSPSGLKRLIYDEPCLTITSAATREFLHPDFDRTLTLRECARIQTFPDDFAFCGNSSEKIKQIGNAIPPLLARTFAEHILSYGFSLRRQEGGKLTGFSLTKAGAMSPALKVTNSLLTEIQDRSSGLLKRCV